MASFVRLSCGPSCGGGAGSNALLWPQSRMPDHLEWVKLLIPLHGTKFTSVGSNTAEGDTQNQICLSILVKFPVLRKDVAEGISSAPGTWNYQSPLLEQHQPCRDDIPGCSCSPYPLVRSHCIMTDSDQHHLHSPGWLEA